MKIQHPTRPSLSPDEENVPVRIKEAATCDEPDGRMYNLATINLATIPEDSYSSQGYPARFYDGEDDRNTCRYIYSFCKYCRCWVLLTLCSIVLLTLLYTQQRQNHGGYPSDSYARPPTLEEDDLSNSPAAFDYNSKQKLVELSLNPIWLNVSNGWQGASYDEGTEFCKSISGSRFVCPYDAYCPGGPGSPPFGGIRGEEAADWLAPAYDDQPLLIGVGSTNTCFQTGILNDSNKKKSKYLLCCSKGDEESNHISDDSAGGIAENESLAYGSKTSEPTGEQVQQPTKIAKLPANPLSKSSESSYPVVLTEAEQSVLDYMNPLWFGRKDGYQGTTHQEAVDFCNNVGDRELCAAEAYCPNGSPKEGEENSHPLFLRMNAFPTEEWVAHSLDANSWLLVGTINGNHMATCHTYESLHNGAQPDWGLDGNRTELKEHVMCCLKQN